MNLTIIINVAEEGGFWAEVENIPGCITEGDTREELIDNLLEAIEGCLYVMVVNKIKSNLEKELSENNLETTYRKEFVFPFTEERMDAFAH